jgi:lipopolysaccharide heptosyltransferase II
VNLAHLGDVLMTTPAITALAERFPNAEIVMLVGPWGRPAIEHHPKIHEVIEDRASWFDRGRGSPYLVPSEFATLVRRLHKGDFDVAILFKSFFQENLVASLAGIPCRVGYGLYGGGFLHTSLVPFPWGAHTVEQHLALVKALGCTVRDARLEVFPTADEQREAAALLDGPGTWIALHLGAGVPARQWPIERYARLAEELAARFAARIVLVGAKEDLPLLERFRALTSLAPAVAAGRLNVTATAALLSRCVAFVGNDSGPAHLAAAAGIPTVVVFSGTNDVAVWKPWGEHVVTLQEHPECAPCGLSMCARADHACMTWISVERVLAAVAAVTRLSESSSAGAQS